MQKQLHPLATNLAMNIFAPKWQQRVWQSHSLTVWQAGCLTV